VAMIPESGSLSEFKEALVKSYHPAVGEVYLRDKGICREYWVVKSYNWSRHVVFETYWCLDEERCFKQHLYPKQLSSIAWENMLRTGLLSYIGHELPLRVMSNRETREAVYETYFR